MSVIKEEIKNALNESANLKKKVADSICENIEEVIKLVINCYKNNGKILICGNGGSAADAQHFASEFINKFKLEREPLPAIALTTDNSILTSVGNDAGFDYIFDKQIKALGNEGDILMVITTSDISMDKNGHSANIAKAILAGKEKGMKIIGLVSIKSKYILKYLDLALIVPHSDTPRIQEAHITILHIICEIVEKNLFQ